MLTDQARSGVRQSIRQGVQTFFANWRLFLGIHVFVNALSLLVLAPILSLILGWLVLASGHTALTDEDILFFVLSPAGMFAMLVAGALYTTVIVFQQAAMIAAASEVTSGHTVSIAGLSRYMLLKFWPLFRLALQMVGRTALVSAPFLTAGAGIYFLCLTEFDINYYITQKPPVFWWAGGMILVCLLALIALLLRIFSGWVLALPMLILNNERPQHVLPMSRKASVSMRMSIAITLLAIFVGNALLLGLASFLLEMAVDAGVILAGESLKMLAYILGLLLITWLAINVAITFLSNSALSLVIIYMFVRLVPRPGGWQMKKTLLPAATVTQPRTLWTMSSTKVISLIVLSSLAAGLVVNHSINSLNLEDRSIVIAHRGASADAPENTLAAMELAIEQGADWVEIDVQETLDGEVVVIHDGDLKKVGGRSMKVFDSSLQDLQSVDIGSWKDPEFSNQRIPTLRQLLDLCKDRINVLIELKYYGQEKQLEQRVASIVEAADMQDQVRIMSLSHPGIQTMKSIRPGWRIGLLASVALGDITLLEADFYAVNANFASRTFIRHIHSRGKEVLVWTINDPISMSAMMSKGVDGLITDRPQLASDIRLERASLSIHERIMIQLASYIGKAPARPEQ